ncbi:uncharacterized protein TNCV_144221 [Trichonephila clavipes]|nr:uncharacterized protein TNCV_144221 [Trichonephila clavipes]
MTFSAAADDYAFFHLGGDGWHSCFIPLLRKRLRDSLPKPETNESHFVRDQDCMEDDVGAPNQDALPSPSIVKQFGKAVPKDGDCFKCLRKKFPSLSEAKLKEGIFVDTDICKLMKDDEFETCMTAKEKESWVIFKDVVRKFRRNCEDPDCKRIVMNKLKKFQE